MFEKKEKTINCNQKIIDALIKTRETLSDEAQNSIRNFLETQKSKDGGFVDRAGKPDLYYSIFGYTLALVLDSKIEIEKELNYLQSFDQENQDLVHSVCLVRAFFLVYLIDLRQKSRISAVHFLKIGFAKNRIQDKLAEKIRIGCRKLMWQLENYIAEDGGFNHNQKGAGQSTVYANYLIWTLYQDMQNDEEDLADIQIANSALQLTNGSFANDSASQDGITSASAAALIMNDSILETKEWIKKMRTNRGGYKAAEGAPVADLLSTSTALLSLQLSGEDISEYAEQTLDFINLHWDQSGGFFGSVADMTCDVEYTYYALLALGILS